MPTVLIDADGCPVVDLTIRICKPRGTPVLILCDTAHRIERDGADTLVFDKGADSVDFALVNRVRPGDIVITQNYGLAGMCLARSARVLNQNGMEYTAENIDSLLETRYQNKNSSVRASTQKGLPSARRSRIFNLQRRWRGCWRIYNQSLLVQTHAEYSLCKGKITWSIRITITPRLAASR